MLHIVGENLLSKGIHAEIIEWREGLVSLSGFRSSKYFQLSHSSVWLPECAGSLSGVTKVPSLWITLLLIVWPKQSFSAWKWKSQANGRAAKMSLQRAHRLSTVSADKNSGRLGCFGWILVLISLIFIAGTFPITIFMCVKVKYAVSA